MIGLKKPGRPRNNATLTPAMVLLCQRIAKLSRQARLSDAARTRILRLAQLLKRRGPDCQ